MICRLAPLVVLFVALASGPAAVRGDDEPVFSGPQKGEKLAPFEVHRVYGDDAGKAFDPVAAADGKPLAIVFFHDRTRPAFGLMRTVTTYAGTRAKDGLAATVVFLSADPTETEKWLGQVQRLMPEGVTIAVSKDGIEGPGAYGLNRNVQLTILVGKEGKVTDNFALVQPSEQADGPRVLKAIVDVLGGGEIPTIASLTRGRMPDTRLAQPSAELRKLLDRIVDPKATEASVEELAATIEAHVANRAEDRAGLGTFAEAVIRSRRTENTFTAAARPHLAKWARAYGPNLRASGRTPPNAPSPELGNLVRSLIQKDATAAQVDELAAKIEAHVKENDEDRAALARITNTIANSDRLANYGNEQAQTYLKKWAKEYASDQPRTDAPERD
jgi:hypothetical protein